MTMSLSTCSFNSTLPPHPFARFDFSFARPVWFSRCVVSSKNRFLGGCFSSKPMSGWVEISPLRGGSSSDGVEGVGALEKDDVLIDGQMDFSPDLASGGLQSTLNRLSKWIVAILFGAYVIWRHDAEAMWAVTGSIVNVLLSIVLKHTLKQERPVSTSESDHGMPSSHAQSLLYAAVFTVLSYQWITGTESNQGIDGKRLDPDGLIPFKSADLHQGN
ncbi:hypothetical protein Sjap_010310 [Stephania japonica]|uniref:Dolichyldiphosphatase n=1 Tax=Stephania japonica TaxID=461633 RepID=A0AAP0J9C7_9MAGN